MRPCFLLLVLGVFACTPAPVRLTDSGASASADDYGSIVKHWTRSAESYEGFEGRIFVHSTYLSWPLRNAQVSFRQDQERLTNRDVESLSDAHREQHEAGHEFFVAAYTNQWEWNTLDRVGDEALWRIRLLNRAGGTVAPILVRRIQPAHPVYQELFPYFGRAYTGYVVRFPRLLQDGRPVIQDSGGAFTLRISGPKGAVDLLWEVAE